MKKKTLKNNIPKDKREKIRTKETLCPYYKKCGGCDYQGLSYTEQLKKKEDYVRKLMKPFCITNDIVGMDSPQHYRHKVHAVFDCTKRGEIVAGVYRKNSHEVVDVRQCMIEDPEADAIVRDVKDLLPSFKIRIYDEDTGYGLLRHVLIRKGYATGQIMLVLVLANPVFPSKNHFIKAIRKLHPKISTIVLNVNNKRTSMVLGERNITIYGKGYIEDELCGCTFRISPTSFYQVNPKQTELLYNKAIEYAGLTNQETVIDAYCGTGTIGLVASKHAGNVIGVERNKDAIFDAIKNAKRNEAKNIRFYQDDAGKFMVRMANENQSADVVIMDPPRAGSDEAFLSSIIRLSPKRVVYVSCNPETLARDVRFLCKNGYEAIECTPFDCFPYTEHVESLVLLKGRSICHEERPLSCNCE